MASVRDCPPGRQGAPGPRLGWLAAAVLTGLSGRARSCPPAFWLSRGIVVAGMNVNVWDVNDDIQSLIRSARPVDLARLTNPEIPLPEV